MERIFIRIIKDDDSTDGSDSLCNCVFSSGCRFNIGYLDGYSDSVMLVESEDD